MVLSDDGAQVRTVDVRVDLRRGDISVPEQFLHDAQVGAAGEHVGGEAVAEHVRMHRAESGSASEAADYLPDRDPLQGPPVV
jgi:hypothetical protein